MGSDQKITQLTELALVDLDDILPIVENPAVSPVTKKATVANLFASHAIEYDGSAVTLDDNVIVNGNLGIGTDTVPHAGVGVGLLAIEGTDSGGASPPFIQLTTAFDNYPVMTILPYKHDANYVMFDAYYNTSDSKSYSSFSSSSFMIGKNSSQFTIFYATTGAGLPIAGWLQAMNIDTSGYVYVRNHLIIGVGGAGINYAIRFDGENNDGWIFWMEDEDYFLFQDDMLMQTTERVQFNDASSYINDDGTNMNIVTNDDLNIDCGANKTIELQQVVYEDIRVSSGNIDRPGLDDPTWVSVTPGGGAITTRLLEFAVDDIGTFTVQIPHCYKTGQDIRVHLHWTPGARGNEENGKYVGWKVDYSWANINGAFEAMGTAVLTDACNGVDWEHNMTPEATIDGHTVAKGISSMLICNVKRTDTGADDDWASSTSGQLPLLLEVDFHFPIDTMGSRDWGTK